MIVLTVCISCQSVDCILLELGIFLAHFVWCFMAVLFLFLFRIWGWWRWRAKGGFAFSCCRCCRTNKVKKRRSPGFSRARLSSNNQKGKRTVDVILCSCCVLLSLSFSEYIYYTLLVSRAFSLSFLQLLCFSSSCSFSASSSSFWNSLACCCFRAKLFILRARNKHTHPPSFSLAPHHLRRYHCASPFGLFANILMLALVQHSLIYFQPRIPALDLAFVYGFRVKARCVFCCYCCLALLLLVCFVFVFYSLSFFPLLLLRLFSRIYTKYSV